MGDGGWGMGDGESAAASEGGKVPTTPPGRGGAGGVPFLDTAQRRRSREGTVLVDDRAG